MAETLTLTLLVDKERNRVVFAESDHRFVDILLSFLTLPMATISRLLDKSFSLGSLDRLYKSVEDLDSQFLQSEACKSMLLRPRSVSGAHCEGLVINVYNSDHRVYYKCSRSSYCSVSAVGGVMCVCGGRLDVPIVAFGGGRGKGKGSDGVFVKGEGRFMVSDDLMVRPVSMGESLVLLNRFGIDDRSILKKKVVNVGKEDILSLLKRSVTSRTPLTDVFLQEPDIFNVREKSVVSDITLARINQKRTATNSKRINVKLYLSADSDKVVCAEEGADLLDLLLSFLAFPLGSVVGLLEKHSSLGCIDNLYDSVELLSSDYGYMKSEECTNMLLAPMLPPYFGRHYKSLSIWQVSHQMIRTCECTTRQSGKGYARGMVKFMVTDEIEVTAMSAISGFHIINKSMAPISSLEEAEASLGEAEALNLLKACLISKSVLSDVFSPYPMMLLEQNWCGRVPRKCDGFPDQGGGDKGKGST